MVEWPSSESERTFDQSAANGRKEPKSTNAARRTNGCFPDKYERTKVEKKANVLRALDVIEIMNQGYFTSERRQIRCR